MLKAVFLLGEDSPEAASLLGVSAEDLARALKERIVTVRRETTIVQRTSEEARAARDALAKELYARTFAWVVELTNEATSTDSWEASCGLLDIFGFESFPVNRFEQLCINYANERLQEKFCRDLFRSVQAEYEAENVPWAPIDFPDAQAALKLIEGSMGVVDVLDEECARPGAISASRRVEAPSRRRRDSCPSHNEVGGFFFEFEAVRTEPRCSAQVARSWLSCRS
jgi:myosin-5